MAVVSAEESSPADPCGQLHPSLLSIAAAVEQSEHERRQRMSLAHEFLGIIDAWAKSKAETDATALVAPFIEKLAPILTAMAIGSAITNDPPYKTTRLNVSSITTAAPRMRKVVEKIYHNLPKKPP